MRRVWGLVLAIACAAPGGCTVYFVDPAQAAAVSRMGREERTHTAIPAERADGSRTFVRGAPVRVLSAPDARGRARARAIRPMTIGGLVLLAPAVGWLATGAFFTAIGFNCQNGHNDACGPSAGFSGVTMLAVGGLEAILAAALIGHGVTSVEVPAGKPGFTFLP